MVHGYFPRSVWKDAFFSKVPAQKRNAADAHVPALGLTAPVLVLTTLRGHGESLVVA